MLERGNELIIKRLPVEQDGRVLAKSIMLLTEQGLGGFRFALPILRARGHQSISQTSIQRHVQTGAHDRKSGFLLGHRRAEG